MNLEQFFQDFPARFFFFYFSVTVLLEYFDHTKRLHLQFLKIAHNFAPLRLEDKCNIKCSLYPPNMKRIQVLQKQKLMEEGKQDKL